MSMNESLKSVLLIKVLLALLFPLKMFADVQSDGGCKWLSSVT